MPQQKPTICLSRNIKPSAPKKPVGRQPIFTERQIKLIDPMWCPGPVPHQFWEDEDNRRNYLLWLAHKLRYRRMEHWYKITRDAFSKNYGHGVSSYHRRSPSGMLRHFYPEYDWQEWLFGYVPRKFWFSKDNQRRFLEWVGHKLGVRRWEDWYRVVHKDVLQFGGDAFLTRYNYRMVKILSTLFPEHDWKPWLFAQVPDFFWTRWENRRDYMVWLGEQLGFQKPEDWYRVKFSDFQRHHGSAMLDAYNSHGSIISAIMDVFPEYPWEFWLFNTPQGFFKVQANRLRYLRWLGNRLGFKRPSDWYRVTGEDFRRNYGGGCFPYYQNSPARAAMDLYPKYPWKEWLFKHTPHRFWAVPENQRRYMSWLGKQLGFRRPEDWHRVRQQDFYKHYGQRFLKHYRTIGNLLRHLLPDLDWDSVGTDSGGAREELRATKPTSKCR